MASLDVMDHDGCHGHRFPVFMLQSGNTADDSRFNPSLTLLGAMGVELIVKPSCLMEADSSDHCDSIHLTSNSIPQEAASPHYAVFQTVRFRRPFPRPKGTRRKRSSPTKTPWHAPRSRRIPCLLALAPFHRDPVLRCRRKFSAW